jgi:hypothetical protein
MIPREKESTMKSAFILFAVVVSFGCSEDGGSTDLDMTNGSDSAVDAVPDTEPAADAPRVLDAAVPGAVGTACVIPPLDASMPLVLKKNAQDCETSLCLAQPPPGGGTVTLCTKLCEEHSDCPGATSDCPGGFVCAPVNGPGGSSDGYPCCEMCLCKDLNPPQHPECAGAKVVCPHL